MAENDKENIDENQEASDILAALLEAHLNNKDIDLAEQRFNDRLPFIESLLGEENGWTLSICIDEIDESNFQEPCVSDESVNAKEKRFEEFKGYLAYLACEEEKNIMIHHHQNYVISATHCPFEGCSNFVIFESLQELYLAYKGSDCILFDSGDLCSFPINEKASYRTPLNYTDQEIQDLWEERFNN